MRTASMPAALIVLFLLSLASRADAEVFLDAYAGYSFTEDNDVATRLSGLQLTLSDVEFDQSFVVGGRVGYWFTTVPFFGLALDASYFRPDIGGQSVVASPGAPLRLGDTDLSVVSVGPQLLIKIPIPIVKPYVFAGPALFITEAEDTGGNFGLPGGQTDVDTSIGLKAGAGIRFVFFGFLGLFAEYQFTHSRPEFEFRSAGVRRKVETDVDTHHAVVGATIQF